MKKLLLSVIIICLFTNFVGAKIDLVTLPERSSVQITVYNSEDITLVKEMRTMSFKKGMNEIQFSWAGTLIDPTSLDLLFKTTPENFEILDISYPPNIQNTLIWHINCKIEGVADIEISYFTSGLTWAADYVAIADAGEKKMLLKGYVTVTNNSGEDYENTQTRMVVGEIHLVEKIADLAQRGFLVEEERKAKGMMFKEAISRAEMAMAAPAMAPKEIIKEGISEYFLYTIEGRETIKNQWSKRLISFTAKDVPFTPTYMYDNEKYGEQIIKMYKLKNNKEANLGVVPLPNGNFNVYRQTADGKLSFINKTSHNYIPIGEDIELNLASDGLITFETKKMDFMRENLEFDNKNNVSGWDIIEDWKLEIRNSKKEAIPLEITRHFDGDWEIKTDAKYEKIDKRTVTFKLTVPALGKSDINYTLTTHYGTHTH